MSGIPVIVSDFPEMGRTIESSNCGWKMDPTISELYDLIQRLSPEDILRARDHALTYRKTIGWHLEERGLLQVYRDLGA
jgi:hypothetical protein